MQTPAPVAPGATSSAPAAAVSLAELIDAYMAQYAGRDRTRVATLAFWCSMFGERAFATLSEDEIFEGFDRLRARDARVYVGRDADGRPIHRSKGKLSPSTVNRYHAAVMALFTWAIKQRRAPKAWENPARKIERAPVQREATGRDAAALSQAHAWLAKAKAAVDAALALGGLRSG